MLINKDQYNDHAVKVVFSDPEQKHDRYFTGTVDRMVFGSARISLAPEWAKRICGP